MNCASCKFWNTEVSHETENLHMCQKIEPWRSTNKTNILAVVDDESSLTVDSYLFTRADFGCLLFEEK